MDLSVIITTYNRREKVLRLLRSILDSDLSGIDYEIVVVDDCSTDGTSTALRQAFGHEPRVCILRNETNSKVSYSRNRGADASHGRTLFFVDDDVVLPVEAIRTLLQAQSADRHALMSPLMYADPDLSQVWFAGIHYNQYTTVGTFVHKKPGDLDSLPDRIPTDMLVTAIMVDREVFRDIGRFDEELFPFHFEELDFVVRARFKGYKAYVLKTAVLWHDHATGDFLNIPWRLELCQRNRFFVARLWATNPLAEWCAFGCSALHTAAYTGAKLLLKRDNFLVCVAALLKGSWEGFRRAQRLIPYRAAVSPASRR